MGNILSRFREVNSRRAQSLDIFKPASASDSHFSTTHEFTTPENTVPVEPPTNSDLIIGIDFGTTFTGVAYICSGGISKTPSLTELENVVDRISVIKTWPSQMNSVTDKTPSVLAYNKDPPIWGWNVKPTDDPQIAYFKLGLQEDVLSLYQHHSLQTLNAGSALGGYLSDSNWRHPELPEMRSVDYAIDFLSSINRFIKEEILPNRYGNVFLQNQKLSYVLTVPAIWSDKAKELTRTAAVRAGIGSQNLTLITEPEAAALYCATLCKELDLEPGDRFMICDAGGGTVVCFLWVIVKS